MPSSVARGTLNAAKFFLEQARAAGIRDRSTFQHNLEAAIVFGRSVTFHIQKQYAHADGFTEWYALCQERIKADLFAAFVNRQRSFVLKEGPLAVGQSVEVFAVAAVALADVLEVRVTGGQPWYRRSPRTLIEDLSRPIRSRMQRWLGQQGRVAISTPKAASGRVSQYLVFAQEPWNQRPALELMDEYVSTLGVIVDEVEAKFGAWRAAAAEQGDEADEP